MSPAENAVNEKVYHLHSLGVEEQLAVLWYVYRDFVKENITPEAERPEENLGQSEELVQQIEQMSNEDQLQVQRDLIIGKNTAEFQSYKDYSSALHN